MRFLCCSITMVAVIVGLTLIAPALPQTNPSLSGSFSQTGVSAPVWRCTDYKPNGDGSWTANTPVTFNGVAIRKGTSIKPGMSFGGQDLASGLNLTCGRLKR